MTESSTTQGAQDDEVLLSIADGIATILLNRPERRNSFTDAFMEALLDAVERAASDPAVRVILLSGSESCFSVGGDLPEFAAGVFAPAHLTVAESAAQLRRYARASELLHRSAAVSIAAVGGPCAGAGLSLAAACDLRIASRNAVFRTSFIDAGLASDYGGIWSLTRLLGEARAKELFFLSPKLTAEEAAALGLVSRVVDPAELIDSAAGLARSLAGKSPGGLRAMKLGFVDLPRDFGEALDRESTAQKECAYTSDALEAAHAFLERRVPRFTGA